MAKLSSDAKETNNYLKESLKSFKDLNLPAQAVAKQQTFIQLIKDYSGALESYIKLVDDFIVAADAKDQPKAVEIGKKVDDKFLEVTEFNDKIEAAWETVKS